MTKKILFMKFCCIGDVLFTTPAVNAIKRAFPSAYTAYMTGEWSKNVLMNNPYIDEVIVFDAPVSVKNRFKKVFNILIEIVKLRRKRFDILINFHRSFFTALFGFLAGIPTRVGFGGNVSSLLLTNSIPFNAEKHEVDRYLDIVRSIGVASGVYKMEIFPTEKDKNTVASILKKEGLKEKHEPWIAIAPGGGINPLTPKFFNKRWTADRFAQLGDLLSDEYGAKVILVGGVTDIEICIAVSDMMKHKSIIIAGRMEIRETAAFFSMCDLFIGNDSGPLYIAATCIPTISIFGPSDPRLVAPRGKEHHYIWKGIECSPCYHPESLSSNRYLNCNKLDCMNMISVDMVFNVCQKVIKKNTQGYQKSFYEDS